MSKPSFLEYKKLFRFLKPHVGLLAIASCCMFFSTIFSSASMGMIVPVADKILSNNKIIVPRGLPPFLQQFVARINGLESVTVLKFTVICVFFIFLGKMIFVFLQSYLMNMVSLRIVRDVRNKIFEKLQYVPLHYYTTTRTGELISRITNDVNLINNAISSGMTDFIYQVMQVAVFSCIVFYIHFKLAVLSFFVFPAVIVPVVRIGKKIKHFTRRTQEKMADINSLLAESIQGVKLIKAFNNENYEVKRFQLTNFHHYKYTMKTFKRMIMIAPFSEFVSSLAGIGILWFAGQEVIQGKLSFGVFGLFMGSLMSMISPFKKISNTYSLFQQALSASERIYQILDLKTEKEVFTIPGVQPIELTSISEGIAFQNVWFRYHDHEEYVLKNISFQIKKNQVLALVGESGAGKTTVVNLLLRFYDPQKGTISIDNTDIKKLDLTSLRRHMAFVPQETILFNDTIAANIAYGIPDATEEQIRSAAQKALCEDFILKMSEGYQTRIGDRGMKLSGGERQRIAIARVILRNPQILILDEATSNLDNKSEHLIQEALKRVIVDKTVIIIAHRLSTIQQATQIMVLERGAIKESGTHEELLRDSHIYKRLYELQFSR